ncbi:MAG: TIGR03619 family F420-dependent LLM class oxidoreductase [Hyphomicrobiaceae bacterium]
MATMHHFGLDVGIYGALADPPTILRLAGLAESAGFESIWVADHVVFPVKFKSEYPYSAKGDFPSTLDDPLMEPLAVMGVLVGATKRVRIGTAVLIIPYRNPVVTARQLITLDQFSGGRIILGAGVGWLEEEFEALDTFDFKRRGKATDEYIDIFKRLAAGGEVGFQGETYSFDPVFSSPGSVQRPHPPVLIGGIADPALKRVARLGNGWLAVAAPPDVLAASLAKLKTFTTAEGRRFDDISLTYKIFLNIGEAKRGRFDAREPGTGSLDEIVEDLKRITALGFSRIIVRCRGRTATLLEQQMARFVDEIAPRV